jgi:FdhD protein
MSKSSSVTRITRWSGGEIETRDDLVAVEEPLQVVVDGRALAVLMRTPGDDEVLVMGFLLTKPPKSVASTSRPATTTPWFS